ncbi:MAG TPA: tetratricopeptide repeat protein [Candidatus Acidoferrales bacterium]|nr:tetratricopeptide repeat protein [Candidatus Acidoferrales bacterium]
MTSSTPARDGSLGWLGELWERNWLKGLLLFTAVILVYQPAWHGKPLWDDDAHLTPPELRSAQGLARIWIEPGATQQYYPLVYSLFWVEYKLWGDTPLGYHLINIVLHAFSAFLLWKILQRLQVPGAYLAAAIFALHPVCVESVAWISEIKNTLSGALYLGAALVYLKFDRTRNWKFYFAALGLFLLGLMSKTVIATLPAAFLVVFWWQRGKLSWKEDVLPLIPFFAVGMGAGLFTAWMEWKYVGARGSGYDFSIIDRLLIAGRAIWFYLGKLVWPVDLIFIYPRWHVSQMVWWQYLFPIMALLVSVGLWLRSRRNRAPLAVWLFYVGTLFPALGFFNVYPFRYSFVADHFQYLAGIGPITLAAAGIAALFRSLIDKRPFLQLAVCGTLILVLGILSWRQSESYTDVETLWRNTIARNPNAFLAYNNLGNILVSQGETAGAIALFRRAIEIKPDYAEAHYNLANALDRQGKPDEAIDNFQKAIEINPDFVAAHNNLGTVLLNQGRLEEASEQYHQALAEDPTYAEAHSNLGFLLSKQGRTEEAIEEYRKAIELNPNRAEFYSNLGNLLATGGQSAQAVEQFRKALGIEPDNAKVHYNLANILFAQGQWREAAEQYQQSLKQMPDSVHAHYQLGLAFQCLGESAAAIAEIQKVLELDPNHVAAQNNLAWILATCPDASLRNGPRAVELAQRAVQLSAGTSPQILDTLAAAYAEAGRFPEAITTARRALELSSAQSNKPLAEVIQNQLKLFKTHAPYHEQP